MHLHAAEIINVHWTRKIEEEWTRNAAAGPEVDAEAIHACLRGMRDAVDGWEVTGYRSQKVALVTKNIKDFPEKAFENTEVSPYPLGTYIDGLYAEEPEQVIKVAEACRRKLKRPPLDKEQYVAVLESHRCIELARGLASMWDRRSWAPKAPTGRVS